jgi:periplasmic divalent cation tolerance protein
MADEIVMITTTTSLWDEARHIAASLMEERLAACVQMMAIDSYYRWRGRVQHAAEILLLIKTTAAQAQAVQARIAEMHNYGMPEALVFPAAGGLPHYLDWVRQSVAPEEA